MLTAGLAGLTAGLRLPPEVPDDPARGHAVERLPHGVAAALSAFRACAPLRTAMGEELYRDVLAVRAAEAERFAGLDAAEVFRTSQAQVHFGGGPVGAWRLDGEPYIAVEPVLAEGQKCARSWRILPEVGSDPRYPDLSLRDADAVAEWDRTHA